MTMLVIKRKVNDSILIGDNIEIIISEISGDKVKIAINAPDDVKIMRKELKETLEFNQNAATCIDIENLNKLKENFKELKNKS